jgi:hypothetical protein
MGRPEGEYSVNILHTDCDWLALHIDTLFSLDVAGRLLVLRQKQASASPRFYLGRTRHGNSWRFRHDEALDSCRRLSRLAAREPAIEGADDWAGPPPPPERWKSMLDVLGGPDQVGEIGCGPAYRFPDTSEQLARLRSLAGPAEAIDPDDAEMMACIGRSFPGFADGSSFTEYAHAIIDDDRALAICFGARGEPGTAMEAGVETLPGERGRGHAPSCVAAWALAVMAGGAIPLYSTSWSNRPSRSVAKKLGLALYAEDWHVS